MEDVANAGERCFISEDDDEDDSIGDASLQGSQQGATRQVYEKQQAEQKRTRIRKDCTVENCINR